MTASYYTVDFRIVVDRPDRRGEDFSQVPAGHRIHTSWQYRTRREALAVFEAILRGDYDFGSEYVACVEVLDRDCYRTRSPRWVRRPVERRRKAGAGQCGYDCGHASCREAAARDAAEGLEIDRCAGCGQPAHASESDDRGLCAPCAARTDAPHLHPL